MLCVRQAAWPGTGLGHLLGDGWGWLSQLRAVSSARSGWVQRGLGLTRLLCSCVSSPRRKGDLCSALPSGLVLWPQGKAAGGRQAPILGLEKNRPGPPSPPVRVEQTGRELRSRQLAAGCGTLRSFPGCAGGTEPASPCGEGPARARHFPPSRSSFRPFPSESLTRAACSPGPRL